MSPQKAAVRCAAYTAAALVKAGVPQEDADGVEELATRVGAYGPEPLSDPLMCAAAGQSYLPRPGRKCECNARLQTRGCNKYSRNDRTMCVATTDQTRCS